MRAGDLFNSENRFFSAMSKIADMLILNVLFLFTVWIGIGPACTAMYYATVKNIRKSRGYVSKEYFHSFRSNFKQGIVMGIVQIVLVVLLYGCYMLSLSMDEKAVFAQIYYTGTVIMIIAFVFFSVFVYPILSRFTLSFVQWVKMTMLMSIRHLPTSLILAVAFAAVALIIIFVAPQLIFIAPAVYSLCSSFLIERIFKKYMPKPEGEDAETRDLWYFD